MVTGIALELYHREQSEYPESLDTLVPSFLTEVPIDRITGTPVHYRLVDGQPLVYSVGADRKDDNGRDPFPVRITAVWDEKPDVLPDGDWVLYPTLNATTTEVR